MILNLTNPCRNIVDHLDLERKILLDEVESGKPLLFHQDIACPFLVERLNDPFHPQAETTIIVDEIIQVVRETVLKIATRCGSSAREVKTRIRMIDGLNHTVLKGI